jgi:DNA-binding MurR/RpiR family transcriptional regulator
MSKKAPWTRSQSFTRSSGPHLLPYQRDNLAAAIVRARTDGRWCDATAHSLAARYNVHASTVYRAAAKVRADD